MLTKLRICIGMSLLIPSLAIASEATVKQAMERKYPGVPIESVVKTPIPGIYEVFANGAVFYVDENVNYLIIDGKMIDVGRKVNLTEERLRVQGLGGDRWQGLRTVAGMVAVAVPIRID